MRSDLEGDIAKFSLQHRVFEKADFKQVALPLNDLHWLPSKILNSVRKSGSNLTLNKDLIHLISRRKPSYKRVHCGSKIYFSSTKHFKTYSYFILLVGTE